MYSGEFILWKTLSDVAQSLITCLSDECGIVLLVTGFPIECEFSNPLK